jgi:phage-related protein
MLGAGASTEDLHAALEDGTVSYNDMLNAIIKLDEEGSGATASFYEQAKANSIGIGSAIANIQNRIGAGWANVLNAIGQQEIHDVLERTADAFKAPLDALASGIAYLKEQISNTSIMENAAKVLGLIGDAISGIWNDGGPTILKSLADSFVSLIDGALQWLADHGDFVTTAVWGLAGALAALAGWQLGAGLAALPGVLAALGTALAANPFGIIVSGIAIVVAALYGFFTQTETGKAIWQGFCDALSTLWTGLQNDWATLMGVLQQEWESFKTWISGIPDWFGGIIAGILAKGAEFRAWWDKSWKEASDSCTMVWNNISTSVSTLWGNIVGGVLAKGGELAQWWNTHWNNVKTTASNAWNSIKSNISSVLSGIVSNISERFNSALSTVRSVFDSIRSTIASKLESARSAVSDAISRIKGLFNFSWSLPRPSLPHINWHMQDVAGLLSIPVFDGISWYAKGGFFKANRPKLGVFGDGTSDEVALPLDKRNLGAIAHGITNEMDGAGSGVLISGNNFYVREEADIDRIADALDRKIRRERMAMA